MQYTDPSGGCIEDACVGEAAVIGAVFAAVEPELPEAESFISAEIQRLVALGWQYHHWFPQQFDDLFDEIGIDVHQFTTLISPQFHQLLHNEGWNAAWEDWLEDAPGLGYGPSEAAEYVYELLQPYINQLEEIGVTGPNGFCAIVPYPGY